MGQSIYEKSMTVDEALAMLSDEMIVDGVSISKRLEGIQQERQGLKQKMDMFPEPVSIALKALNDTESRLFSMAKNLFIRNLIDGKLRAYAYAAPDEIKCITPHEWAFLDMDFQRCCAAGGGKSFSGIKVIRICNLSDEEQDALMGQSGEGLDVFKNLTASDLTVRLLRKEGHPLPDRLEVSAMEKTRTVSFNKIGLASDKSGKLNREGQMLFALSHGQLSQSVKSKAQAMTKLRKIFKGIGIMDKDPFLSKKAGWQPRFKLIDAMEQADKRKAQRAIHVSYDENILYSQPKTKKRNGSHGDHVAPDSPDLKKWNKKDCHECNSVLCVEKSGSVWKCTECGAIRDDAVEGDAATNEWLREHDK